MSSSPLVPAGRHDEWGATPPRLVVCDVDGTLVGAGGAPSDAVAAAVARAQNAGLRVGLATGRMRLGVADLIERLALSGPHVLHNGGQVVHDGQVAASWPVPADVLRRLLDAAHDQDVYVEVYLEHGYVVTRRDERARPHWELLGHEPLGEVASVDELDGEVPKVTAVAFGDDEVTRIEDLLRDAGLEPGTAHSPETPQLGYVNGTHPDADKGRALRAAAELLDLGLDAVAAIGDAANDLPLLRTAGTAVVMGGAGHDVVAAAHLQAPPLAEDGVAAALDAARSGWTGVPVAAPR